MNAFLKLEYEQCFEQYRAYDDRQMALIKYALTLAAAVAGGLFALYKHSAEGNALAAYWRIQLAAAALGVLLFTFILLCLTMNHAYANLCLRQINAIRKRCLTEAELLVGSNPLLNRMPLNPNLRADTPRADMFMLYGMAVLPAAHAALFAASWQLGRDYEPDTGLALVVALVVWGFLLAIVKASLARYDLCRDLSKTPGKE